jgi:hypothetical protein
MFVRLHVKNLSLCKIFMKFASSRQVFEKCSNTQFRENPYSRSRVVVPCGRTHSRTGGRADMTNLTVAFSNFAEASKKSLVSITDATDTA